MKPILVQQLPPNVNGGWWSPFLWDWKIRCLHIRKSRLTGLGVIVLHKLLPLCPSGTPGLVLKTPHGYLCFLQTLPNSQKGQPRSTGSLTKGRKRMRESRRCSCSQLWESNWEASLELGVFDLESKCQTLRCSSVLGQRTRMEVGRKVALYPMIMSISNIF